MEDTPYNPQDEGQRVWSSLNLQLIEFRAFIVAMCKAAWGFVLRNAIIVLVLMIIGGVTGYYLESRTARKFEAGMTVSYNHLEKKIYADLLMKVNAGINQGVLNTMPGFDSISQEAIASLIKVKAFNIKGETLGEDLSIERVPFRVVVVVSHLDHLEELEQALVQYMDSPPFVQERMSYNISKAKKNIIFYEGVVNRLKTQLNNLDQISNAEVAESILDGIVKAHEALEEAHAQLYFNRNIEVLHGLRKESSVAIDRPLKQGGIGAGAGLVVAVLIGFLRKPKDQK